MTAVVMRGGPLDGKTVRFSPSPMPIFEVSLDPSRAMRVCQPLPPGEAPRLETGQYKLVKRLGTLVYIWQGE